MLIKKCPSLHNLSSSQQWRPTLKNEWLYIFNFCTNIFLQLSWFCHSAVGHWNWREGGYHSHFQFLSFTNLPFQMWKFKFWAVSILSLIKVATIENGPVDAWTVLFSPDSKHVVSGSHAGKVYTLFIVITIIIIIIVIFVMLERFSHFSSSPSSPSSPSSLPSSSSLSSWPSISLLSFPKLGHQGHQYYVVSWSSCSHTGKSFMFIFVIMVTDHW